MANKIKIKAKQGGIRYFGAWSTVPGEVREKLASYEPTLIDAAFLRFMDPSSYETVEETKAEEIKVEVPIVKEEEADETVVEPETIEEPKPKNKKKSNKKSTLDPSTEEEENTESLKE